MLSLCNNCWIFGWKVVIKTHCHVHLLNYHFVWTNQLLKYPYYSTQSIINHGWYLCTLDLQASSLFWSLFFVVFLAGEPPDAQLLCVYTHAPSINNYCKAKCFFYHYTVLQMKNSTPATMRNTIINCSYRRDDKGIDVAHEITSLKTQIYQTTMVKYWLGNTKSIDQPKMLSKMLQIFFI